MDKKKTYVSPEISELGDNEIIKGLLFGKETVVPMV